MKPFSEKVEDLLAVAKLSAAEMGESQVGTEHILVALLADPKCSARQALLRMGIDLTGLRRALDRELKRFAKDPVEPAEEFTPRSKDALAYAEEEASDANLVETRHILLGLTLERDGVARRLLEKFGVTHDRVRTAIAKL